MDPIVQHLIGMFTHIDEHVINAVWHAAKPDRNRAIAALLTLSESRAEASEATASTERVLPLCPHGASCVRRTKKHTARFRHALQPGEQFAPPEHSAQPMLAALSVPDSAPVEPPADDSLDESHSKKRALEDAISPPKKKVRRSPCSYGASCYRKNPQHKKDFAHPGDTDWSETADQEYNSALARVESMSAHPPSSPDLAFDLADDDDGRASRFVEEMLALDEPHSSSSSSSKKKHSVPKPKTQVSAPPGQYLSGKVIAITGTLSKLRVEIIKHIESEGGMFKKTVTGDVTHLVAQNPHMVTNKMQKAIDRGVQVVGETFLYRPESNQHDVVAAGDAFELEEPKPEDDDWVDEALWKEVTVGGVRPFHAMTSGESVQICSDTTDSKHTIKRVHDHYYCTCYAWRNQKAAVDSRTCKHLRKYLGAPYEAKRVGGGGTGAPDEGGVIRSSALPGGGGMSSVKHSAPGVMLAHKWSEKVDPTGYWMSEKLDGVRAVFNGKTFLSRNGNEFFAPDWFRDTLPKDTWFDGELFAGRGKFQQAVSIVRTRDSKRWNDITFMIFDVPKYAGKFEVRLAHIRSLVGASGDALGKHIKMVEHRKCSSRTDLLDELAAIEAKGGEGVMLRAQNSDYVSTRSRALLKVKTFHDDEATVIGHEPGKGKYTGHTGALLCKMSNGKTFRCGSGMTDHDRHHPPAIGALITFRYQELTQDGVPRFPVFVGVRIDGKMPTTD